MSKMETNETNDWNEFMELVPTTLLDEMRVVVLEGEALKMSKLKDNAVFVTTIFVPLGVVKKYRKKDKSCKRLWERLQDGSIETNKAF